jgi:hypothetical protein
VEYGGSTNNSRESLNRTIPETEERELRLIDRQRKLAVVPKRGNVIASSYTSPLDLIYLAAKYVLEIQVVVVNGRYDVVFVSCFVSTNRVQQTSFLTALYRSLRSPIIDPPAKAKLQTLEELSKSLSNRIIAIFPEVRPPPPAVGASPLPAAFTSVPLLTPFS